MAGAGRAGALTAEATVEIAAFRAHAMDAACTQPCGMAAVRGLSRRRLEPLAAAHGVEIAIVNAPDRIVVGGRSAALEGLLVAVVPLGASVTPLAVHIASHTSVMKSAAAALRRRLDETPMAAPAAPVLAGIDGQPVYQPARAIETLSRQACHTIDWAACLQGMAEAGCRVILELGPGADLARMAREHLPGIDARSVAEFHALAGAIQWVRRHLD
ncbi:MAG: acyltransferase domain-containing protein [Rhodospirillales bacterium]